MKGYGLVQQHSMEVTRGIFRTLLSPCDGDFLRKYSAAKSRELFSQKRSITEALQIPKCVTGYVMVRLPRVNSKIENEGSNNCQ